VPDISAALSDIVATEAASRGETVDPVRVIEDLKEGERYILEVY
jgi:sulfite reductase alpha subunit-like flavoprotein